MLNPAHHTVPIPTLLGLGWMRRSFKQSMGLTEGWVLTPEGHRRAFLSFPVIPGRDAFEVL